MSAATIGSALTAKRDELGLAKGQAADKIGMSRTTYSSYEQDAQRPAVDVFPALAKFLDISFEELLTLYGATCVAAVRSSLERIISNPKDESDVSENSEGSPLVNDVPDQRPYVTPYERPTMPRDGAEAISTVTPEIPTVAESNQSPAREDSQELEESQVELPSPSEPEVRAPEPAIVAATVFDHSPFDMNTPKSGSSEKGSGKKKKKRKKRKKN